MPSKSPSQHRLMEAAAHTPGGYDGVPQSVGKEFARADKLEAAPTAHAKPVKTMKPVKKPKVNLRIPKGTHYV